MSDKTSIQWSDSTINPIMGCGGCELFPPPGEILAAINRAAARTGVTIDSKAIFKVLVDDCFAKNSKSRTRVQEGGEHDEYLAPAEAFR